MLIISYSCFHSANITLQACLYCRHGESSLASGLDNSCPVPCWTKLAQLSRASHLSSHCALKPKWLGLYMSFAEGLERKGCIFCMIKRIDFSLSFLKKAARCLALLSVAVTIYCSSCCCYHLLFIICTLFYYVSYCIFPSLRRPIV